MDERVRIDLARDMAIELRRTRSGQPALAWESPAWLGECVDDSILRQLRDWLNENVNG